MKKLLGLIFGMAVAWLAYGQQQSASAVGTLAGTNDTVQVTAMGTVGVGIIGTFTMTINFEGSVDGTNWFSVQAYNPTAGTLISNTTATGVYQISASGFRWARVRANPVVSGSATVNLYTMLYASKGGGGGGGGGGSCANCILKDGSVTWTGDDNHGGHNLTNVDTAQFVSLQFSSTGTVDTPPSGYGSYAFRYIGGNTSVPPLSFPVWKNELGNVIYLQPALWDFRTAGYWLPATGANGGGLGLLTASQSGTLTDSAWASTNLYTRTHHSIETCTTGTNNRCGVEAVTNGRFFFRGNAAGQGGFAAVIPIASDTYSTGNPSFAGLVNQVSAWVAVTSSSLTTECNTTHKQFIGVGKDPSDTALTLVSCDGTANITKTTITGVQDCTTPANCSSGGLYLYLYLLALPNDTKIYYQIDNWAVQPPVTLISGSRDCTVAGNCPTATTNLGYYNEFGTGANAGAAAAVTSLFPQYVMSLSQ